MRGLALGGLLLVVLAMTAADYQALRRERRSLAAYLIISGTGLAISGLLIYRPGTPGPTEWLGTWLRPIGLWLQP